MNYTWQFWIFCTIMMNEFVPVHIRFISNYKLYNIINGTLQLKMISDFRIQDNYLGLLEQWGLMLFVLMPDPCVYIRASLLFGFDQFPIPA